MLVSKPPCNNLGVEWGCKADRPWQKIGYYAIHVIMLMCTGIVDL